jgi:hypothetical protein
VGGRELRTIVFFAKYDAKVGQNNQINKKLYEKNTLLAQFIKKSLSLRPFGKESFKNVILNGEENLSTCYMSGRDASAALNKTILELP